MELTQNKKKVKWGNHKLPSAAGVTDTQQSYRLGEIGVEKSEVRLRGTKGFDGKVTSNSTDTGNFEAAGKV